MKHIQMILTTLCAILILSGCDQIKNYNKPHLELSGYSPYTLKITDFAWSYGLTSVNQFNGDFDKLDEKVFNILKGKYGSCLIYIEDANKDKYGNSNDTMRFIAQLGLNELNKYQDWHYWQNNGGVRKLIYNYLNNRNNNSDSHEFKQVDTTRKISSTNQTIYQPSNTITKVYSFSINDLHPSDEERADLDSNTYAVNGIIEAVDFDSGVIEIKSSKGRSINVQFSPYGDGYDVLENLKIAVVPGNKIKSKCARSGPNTIDLVSAVIAQ